MSAMDEKIEKIKQWLGSGSINIFGPPFAGKDTQGEIVSELLGGEMFSSGDILRHNKDNEKLQQLLDAGEIIPSEFFMELIPPYFKRSGFEGKSLILSEVGRVEGEQVATFEAAESSGHPIKVLVLLKMPDEEAFKRFDVAQQTHDRGDRGDDDREVLRTRLAKYHQMVSPVIEWYRDKGLLLEVDGTRTRDEVTQEIIDDLYRRATTGYHD